MTDVADEASQDLAVVITADDEPVVLNPSEEPAPMHECEYCGHLPCACGG
jgi:hypothetical protein